MSMQVHADSCCRWQHELLFSEAVFLQWLQFSFSASCAADAMQCFCEQQVEQMCTKATPAPKYMVTRARITAVSMCAHFFITAANLGKNYGMGFMC